MRMVGRRTVISALALTALARSTRAGAGEAPLPLWPGEPPGGGGPNGPETVDARGATSDVARPSLTVVVPVRPSGVAVLVAAGGGYKRIETAHEAMPAAHWLAARGITAFVLTYRLPGEGWAAGPLAPLQDAQRALRLIRGGFAGQPPFGRVGVLGFSAGGHLMGLAAVRSGFRSYEPVDAADRIAARPDVAALIYPIVTLEAPFDDTSTRRVLVGSHPGPELSAAWSVETHVGAGCPPMFLVQAIDDPIADPANTPILARACERAGVPVEIHRLPAGGHGFGMGKTGSPSALWPEWYAAWLRQHGFEAAQL